MTHNKETFYGVIERREQSALLVVAGSHPALLAMAVALYVESLTVTDEGQAWLREFPAPKDYHTGAGEDATLDWLGDAEDVLGWAFSGYEDTPQFISDGLYDVRKQSDPAHGL